MLPDRECSDQTWHGDYGKMTLDYRESHQERGKGQAYHAEFYSNPYRNMVWRFEREILDHIIRKYCGSTEIRHLDFACGTGRILRFISSYTKQQTGVDVSPSMLEVANAHNQNAEIIETDITRNDTLEGRGFNLITAFRFFPNAQPELRKQAMHALRKHLDDDGYIVFNNHKNTGSTRNRVAMLFGRRNFKGMSIDEIKQLAEEHDLEVIEMYSTCIFPGSESRPLLPIKLLHLVETLLRKIAPLRTLGENLIVVCRKSQSAN